MKLKINDFIEAQSKTTYISEDKISEELFAIDCGEGINILQIPETLVEDIRNLDLEWIRNYPHTPGLKKSISNFWANQATLHERCIFVTEGSMGGIRTVGRLLLERGSRVLGTAPTFNAAESDLKLWGATYEGVPLPKKENYRFHYQGFLDRLDENYQMVFIDNPNNPTGQVIPLNEIRLIVEKAAQYGICVVIDEAYGDYMPKNNSAVSLFGQYDNLIVLRTFSKGLGLAGLRVGYMISSDACVEAISNITDCYVGSSISRLMAESMLKNDEFLRRSCDTTVQVKRIFMKEKWENLSISCTSEMVPILLLTHKNEAFDLAEAFSSLRIKVISGSGFSEIGKNSVRLRVPAENDMEEVLCAFQCIDKMELPPVLNE